MRTKPPYHDIDKLASDLAGLSPAEGHRRYLALHETNRELACALGDRHPQLHHLLAAPPRREPVRSVRSVEYQRRPGGWQRTRIVAAPRLVAASSRGHAPRPATNARTRGGRRDASRSSGGGDSGDSDSDSESDLTRPCECGGAIRRPARGPWPRRCAACRRDHDAARKHHERGTEAPVRPKVPPAGGPYDREAVVAHVAAQEGLGRQIHHEAMAAAGGYLASPLGRKADRPSPEQLAAYTSFAAAHERHSLTFRYPGLGEHEARRLQARWRALIERRRDRRVALRALVAKAGGVAPVWSFARVSRDREGLRGPGVEA